MKHPRSIDRFVDRTVKSLPVHRAGVLLCFLASGCFYFGPINDAPPPPEQAPVIKQTFPQSRTVIAQQNSGACTIEIGLLQVEDAAGVPLTGRIFLNDGNPSALQAFDTTSLPLQFGSTTDFQLSPISTDQPTLMQLNLDPFDLLAFRAYLVPPSEASAVNFIEIVVSDGFNDANFPADPNAFRDPAPGKSIAFAFWDIDLSACSSSLL